MPTKTAVKYPRVVAKLTPEEIALFKQDEEQAEALVGITEFEELEPALQQMKHDFWHKLYQDHKLDPQRFYTIDIEEKVIRQMSAGVNEDAA